MALFRRYLWFSGWTPLCSLTDFAVAVVLLAILILAFLITFVYRGHFFFIVYVVDSPAEILLITEAWKRNK